jgi:hypothetical protein
MKKILRPLNKVLLLFTILLIVVTNGDTASSSKKSTKKTNKKKDVTVTSIEESLDKIKDYFDDLSTGVSHRGAPLNRDPFTSLLKIREERLEKERAVESALEPILVTGRESIMAPKFVVTGILKGDKASYVIINNEVKREGEYLGDYLVKEIIDSEKILISYRDTTFTYSIYDKELRELKETKVEEDDIVLQDVVEKKPIIKEESPSLNVELQ